MINTTTSSYKESKLGDSTLTVYSSLQYNASKYGNRLAFQDEEKKYTWSQSLRLICNVASVLAKKGVGKNSSVLFTVDRTIESIVLLHALLLLGCKTFITNQHVFERIDREQYNIDVSIGIHLKSNADPFMKTWNGKDIFNEGSTCNSDIMDDANFDLDTKVAFIVLFTSGTLGDAKGIQLSQFSYLNNAVTFGDSLRIDASDKYCLVTPVYHCFGIINIISALIKGACTFIPMSTEYDRVLSSIEQYQCTVLNTVPTFFFGLQKSTDFCAESIRSIKKGVIAGGNYSSEQFKNIETGFRMKLLSSYGLTECCATVTFCSYDSHLEERANGVGRFIHSVTGSIQDPQGHELPINNRGEICVKGYTIMSGYYNNGTLQTEFTDENGWFHTGDMGYLDSELNLHVVGRIKNIIICGGENISPKKVEDAILLFSSIDECVVLGVADGYYGEIPCALIQLADPYTVSIDVDELQSFLKDKLERFEIPRRIMVVAQMPKNENGKYDQEAIRKLFS